MATANKILICFLFGFIVNSHAQTYAKYSTQQVKGSAGAKPETKSSPSRAAAPSSAVVAPTSAHVSPSSSPSAEVVAVKEIQAEEPAANFGDLMKRASAEYLNREYKQAFKTYTEAYSVSPEESKYLVLQKRGWSYYAVKDYDKSIEDCTVAIEKTKIPNEQVRGSLYILRSLSYKLRNKPGDMERACADLQKAKEAGVNANNLDGYKCK